MKKFVILNKREGETPLEALHRFRSGKKKYKELKMTYAGRLDPMARGLLLVLLGEETRNKEKYLKLDKEYKFEILFGFATDTQDILGKVVSHSGPIYKEKELKKLIKKSLPSLRGKSLQPYPIYSSKTVSGRPLFEYARQGMGVEIPEREINIKRLRFIELRKIKRTKLLADIEKRIGRVKGDFRQKNILKTWRHALGDTESGSFYIGSFVTKCTSGTYVRGIARSLGEKIGIPSLAYSIQRTKIGKFAKIQQ